MKDLNLIISDLKSDSDKRYESFKIEEISSIATIKEEAYLLKPIWVGGHQRFVCVFIDLDDSTKITNLEKRQTVAKIYDYFTQNIYDILNIDGMSANYVDIKGDGGFGIYEGDKAVFKALVAAVTFKTFFEKHISTKFIGDLGYNLNCKLSISQGRILVRKIGARDDNNEVWAGDLVNNAYKISSLKERIYAANTLINKDSPLVIVDDEVFKKLQEKSQYTIMSCGCPNGNPIKLWESYRDTSSESEYKETVYYLRSSWCNNCGDRYMQEILK